MLMLRCREAITGKLRADKVQLSWICSFCVIFQISVGPFLAYFQVGQDPSQSLMWLPALPGMGGSPSPALGRPPLPGLGPWSAGKPAKPPTILAVNPLRGEGGWKALHKPPQNGKRFTDSSPKTRKRCPTLKGKSISVPFGVLR